MINFGIPKAAVLIKPAWAMNLMLIAIITIQKNAVRLHTILSVIFRDLNDRRDPKKSTLIWVIEELFLKASAAPIKIVQIRIILAASSVQKKGLLKT